MLTRIQAAMLLLPLGCLSCGSTSIATRADGAGDSEVEPDAEPELDAAADGDARERGAPESITVNVPSAPTRYPTHALGLNYWSWVKSWGAPVEGTEALVRPLAPKALRLGGAYPDNGAADPFSIDVMTAGIAYAQAVGAAPIVQIPIVADAQKNRGTAENAASIVKELNVVRSLGVVYFSIGNEPDLYSDQGSLPGTYTAHDYCVTFTTFADAMKAVDPAIKVLGPELSWKYSGSNDWLTPFLKECGAKADIVTIHRYPFDAVQSTAANALADGASYRALLSRLRRMLDNEGFAATPLAVTEANVTWDDAPERPVLDGSPGTVPAGLWIAENYGISLEEGVWTVDYWSIKEGWSLGMLNNAYPQPAYWALSLYGEHFGPERATTTATLPTTAAFASRDSSKRSTSTVIINRDSAAHPLKLSILGVSAAVAPVELEMPALSVSAVVVPDEGSPSAWVYSGTEAAASVGPRRVM